VKTYVLGLVSPTLAEESVNVRVLDNRESVGLTLGKSRNECVGTGHYVRFYQIYNREKAVSKVMIASSWTPTFVQVGSHAFVVAADQRIVLPRVYIQR
jgi:hypothetical protein